MTTGRASESASVCKRAEARRFARGGPGTDPKRERARRTRGAQRRARRGGRFGRRGFAVAAAAAIVLVLLGTVAYAAVRPAHDDAAKQLLQRSGRVRIKNSRGGDALVGMQGMLPGDHVRDGDDRQREQGARPLLPGPLQARRDPGRGRRAPLVPPRPDGEAALHQRRPQLVYTGPLRQMPLLKLGTFRPRESRTYRFAVLFPEGGPSLDDRFQRATTSLQFDWYARRAR